MGPQEYQDALDALNSPDAPAPVKAAAKRLVERYSSAMAKEQLKGRTSDSLAEGSSLGPTGLDAVQAAGVPTPEQADEKARRVAKVEAEHPGIAKALQLRAPALAPVPQSGQLEEDFAAEEAQRRQHYDNSLQNLSKRKELAAPAEWHPPTPVNPQSPFDSVWGKLAEVKKAMPDWAGGGTEHYIEPSVEQFRLEMAPVLGPAVEAMAEGSPAYHEYADKKWIAALGRAQTEGRSIVRDAFRPKAKGGLDAALDLVRPGALQGAGQMARSAAIGADSMLTGGIASTGAYLPHDDENVPTSFSELGAMWRDATAAKAADQAAAPVSSMVGGVLGSVHPLAVGNLAVKGAGKLAPGAAGKLASSTTGRILAGAPAGYIGAAATDLVGQAPDVAMGEESLGAALERANNAGMSGAVLGLIGSALGAGIRAEGRALRENTPLGVAEQGGARVRPIRGVDRGATNRALEARARAEGIGESYSPDVPSMLARDLSEPFARHAQATEAGLIREGQPLREFERTFANERHPLKNTIQAILNARKKLVQSDGTVASVNQPELAKLDKLLDDVMSTSPQKPEYLLEPKDPMRLGQLERAVDVHGELGVPETFRRDVANINEMSTPTRAVTPPGNAGPPPPREPLATVPDFGPYGEGLPDIEGGIAAGLSGERIRSLHEARLTNPDVFDITAREASERALGDGLPQDHFLRIAPKPKNPEDLRQLVAGVRQRHESSSLTKEPFPDYEKIKRAFHQDRDAFLGETDAIKQSDTFTLPSGETVRGYSAANARLSQKTEDFENFLSMLGFKGKTPAPGDEGALMAMENLARNYGRGNRPPAVDDALRRAASETDMSPTLEGIRRYRAMKELEQMVKLSEIFRGGGSGPTVSMSGTSARLRLDPILQGLLPGVERLGTAGAVFNAAEDMRRLPPQVDEATLEEIQRALQP